jgi:hypothetical protein
VEHADVGWASERAERPSAMPALFRATVGRFDDPALREAVDRLAWWVREAFAADLSARPSRHLYVSTLPAEVIADIDLLRQSEAVHAAILSQLPAGTALVPLDATDELYLSHYNKDLAGDHGLFATHYDGNLRFVPFGVVVRALIYLTSDGSYEVVFRDSGVRHGFKTYEFGVLDFHRELHHVEGAWREGTPDRFLLKCNTLAITPRERWLLVPLRALNLGQFYVVKAAMEYSKSPKTLPQRVVGAVCNLIRVLNNLHPVLPHAAILATMGLVMAGFVGLVAGV